MSSKLNLFGSALLLASVLGLAPAHAEGVAKPDGGAAPAAAPSAKSRAKSAGKRAGKAADAATTPAAVPAPSPEKMQELQKHPEARSGRGHL